MATCPNRHESNASDFCPVCGVEMTADARPDIALSSASALSAQPLSPCPVCEAKRSPGDGQFCEVCGYNFSTGLCGVPFSPPQPPSPPPLPDSPPPPEPELVADRGASNPPPESAPGGRKEIAPAPPPVYPKNDRRWRLVASIDLSVTGVPEAEGPAEQVERVFPLDLPDQLVGRRSLRRGLQPEISLDGDDGVSHRHAKISRQPDGTFALLDLGSSNGTALNGKELKPNVLTPLAAGDRIGLGKWTRLTFEEERSIR